MKLYGEYFSKGHPDRLCDKIVDTLAYELFVSNANFSYRLNCRIDINKVYIYGEIRDQNKKYKFDYKKADEVIKSVFKEVGYGLKVVNEKEIVKIRPTPEELEISYDIKIYDDEGDYNERIFSSYALGYAYGNSKNQYLPVAHYLALVIGMYFTDLIKDNYNISPNFRLEVTLEKQGEYFAWDSLIINIIHNEKTNLMDIYSSTKNELTNFINSLAVTNLDPFDVDMLKMKNRIYGVDKDTLRFNGHSNSRLSFDYYGPQIPHPDVPIHGKPITELNHIYYLRKEAIDWGYKHRWRVIANHEEVFITLIMRNDIDISRTRDEHTYYLSSQDSTGYVIKENGLIMYDVKNEVEYTPFYDVSYYEKERPNHKSESIMLDLAGRNMFSFENRKNDIFKKTGGE